MLQGGGGGEDDVNDHKNIRDGCSRWCELHIIHIGNHIDTLMYCHSQRSCCPYCSGSGVHFLLSDLVLHV